MNSYARCSLTLVVLATAGCFTALRGEAQAVNPSPQLMAAASAAPVVTGSADAALQPSASQGSLVSDSATLPDAPSVSAPRASAPEAGQAASAGGNVAPKYEKSISPDQTAQPLTGRDKVVLSLRQLYAPIPVVGIIIAGGYTHLVNGAPNYGTNGEAAAQRIGASFARGESQELFADAILCPLLHDDPRYYVQGSQHSFVHRVFYAGTRTLVTKTDSGRSTVNAPLLISYAASSALNLAYYPPINRNFKDTASEFGGSVGGAAIGFLFNEFFDGVLRAIHLESK